MTSQFWRQQVYVFPALIWTTLFFVVPLVIMTCYSFWELRGGGLATDWSLVNYREFFSNRPLRLALWNTIVVATLSTVISILLAYPLAYILAYKVPKEWQWLALVLAVLPFWTSYLVRSYSWLLVLSKKGIVSVVLTQLGLIDEAVSFLNSRGTVILGFVHFFAMLLTLTIFVNLVQIKPSYRLAAADLGAAPWRVFLRVTLPLSLPGVMVGGFLTFVITAGDYITPAILGGGQDLLMAQAIMLQIGRHGNYPMAATLGVTLMGVVTLAFLLCARWLKMDRV